MIKFGNFVVTDNNSWLGESSSPGPIPPTPVLPAGTVRVRTSDGNAPRKVEHTTYETATLVEGTSNVYDVYKSGDSFRRMFEGSTNVAEVLDANATGITNMDSMFYDCTSLTSVSLSNTSSVTDMSQMFRDCTALTTVTLFDTSSVIDMSQMFYHCAYLTSVPLFNTANVTNMSGMFDDCARLATVPLFNTSSVTRMDRMFAACAYGLTTVPLFDTSSVTNMATMFSGCLYLTTVPLFDTSSVTNMSSMFYNCYAVESGALALYQQASSQTNPPSTHNYTFHNCGSDTVTGAAELAQIPSDWK